MVIESLLCLKSLQWPIDIFQLLQLSSQLTLFLSLHLCELQMISVSSCLDFAARSIELAMKVSITHSVKKAFGSSYPDYKIEEEGQQVDQPVAKTAATDAGTNSNCCLSS